MRLRQFYFYHFVQQRMQSRPWKIILQSCNNSKEKERKKSVRFSGKKSHTESVESFDLAGFHKHSANKFSNLFKVKKNPALNQNLSSSTILRPNSFSPLRKQPRQRNYKKQMLEKALYEVKRFEGIFEKFQADINQILQEQFEALHATKLKLLMELGLHPPSEENIKISSTTFKRSVSSEEEQSYNIVQKMMESKKWEIPALNISPQTNHSQRRTEGEVKKSKKKKNCKSARSQKSEYANSFQKIFTTIDQMKNNLDGKNPEISPPFKNKKNKFIHQHSKSINPC